MRKRINTINRLDTNDGKEIFEEPEINETATKYFQNLFSSNGVGNLSHLLTGINNSISLDINTTLLVKYTAEKIFIAVKGMGPTKAPGYDGFLALFFQKYWNLCTIIYKIVAKTIANRLQEFIGRCIDNAQNAFVPRRLISDNVLIAYEILHTLRQKRMGKKGFMAVKLDMSKAYDRVDWAFLKEVMLRMGFAKEWVSLILRCISTVSYVVTINGRRGNVFKPTRGLRQGDPLSHFLFF